MSFHRKKKKKLVKEAAGFTGGEPSKRIHNVRKTESKMRNIVTEKQERFYGVSSAVFTSLTKILMGDGNGYNYNVMAELYTVEEDSLNVEQAI